MDETKLKNEQKITNSVYPGGIIVAFRSCVVPKQDLEGHAAGPTMGNVVKDSWSSHNCLVVDLPPSING